MVERKTVIGSTDRERGLCCRRITVDLDGVCVMAMPLAIDWVNQKYKTSYTIEQMNHWGWLEQSLQNDLGLSKEQSVAVWSNPEVMSKAPPVSGSIRAVQALTLRGAEIFFATARQSVLREVTFAWLERNLPFIRPEQVLIRNDNHSLGGTLFKMETIKRIKPDLHVEDSTEIASMLSGIQVVLVKQNWNQEAPPEMRKNWYEIYKMAVYGQ